MFEFKRQHPVVILSGIIQIIKNILFPLLLAVILRGGIRFDPTDRFMLLWTGGVVLLTGFSIIYSILRWYFYLYSYKDGTLLLNYGILVKKHRQIKQERVQTITVKADLLLRLFGLVSISIETAGGKLEPEFKIAALSKSEAESLKVALKTDSSIQNADENSAGKSESSEIRFAMSFKRLLAAGVTSREILAIFAFLYFVYTELSAFIPQDTINRVVEDLFAVVVAAELVIIVLGVIGVLILTLLLSIAKYMLAYAYFSVSRKDDILVIERGLLEKKHIEIKLHRVQAVTVVEGMLRQPFGFCEIRINAVADSGSKQSYSPVVHPFIQTKDVQTFLNQMLPGYSFRHDLDKLPRRSLKRYLLRGTLPFILVSPAIYFLPYGYLALLSLPVLAFAAFLRYKDAGSLIENGSLTLRFRKIARTTAMISKPHIQNLIVRANFFQKLSNVRTVQVMVLSSPAFETFSVIDISGDEADRIWYWFSWKGHESAQSKLFPIQHTPVQI